MPEPIGQDFSQCNFPCLYPFFPSCCDWASLGSTSILPNLNLGLSINPIQLCLCSMPRESLRIAKASNSCHHLLFICQGISSIPHSQPSDPVSLNYSSFLPGSVTLTQRKTFKSVKRCLMLLPSSDTLCQASNLSDIFSLISKPDFTSISFSFYLQCLSSPLFNSFEIIPLSSRESLK